MKTLELRKQFFWIFDPDLQIGLWVEPSGQGYKWHAGQAVQCLQGQAQDPCLEWKPEFGDSFINNQELVAN